ncbi:MAG: glycosyltransferase family 2 protein [Acidobacteria bacterium]|nr:MAG: glycosyltransferase family 2 protein [Acidobacteriota bacterium]
METSVTTPVALHDGQAVTERAAVRVQPTLRHCRHRLSIIVPIYNESLNIDRVVARIQSAPLPEGVEKEIILVDDGSNDGTSEKLEKYKGVENITVHHAMLNFGKGTAIRVGIRYATGDLILIQDGDMEYDPNDYPKLIQPILDGRAHVVYGSRFLGSIRNMRWPNFLANKILTLAVNVLFGGHITDEATAYKVFRADVLRQMNLRATRFEFCPEVTAKVLRAGYRIHEVPITYHGRSVEEGKKIRWYDGVIALLTLFRYRLLR